MDSFDEPRQWADAIADYLAQHPLAADGLDGIARWWLDADRSALPRVQLALDRLEREQIVIRRTGLDGREHYGIGPLARRGQGAR